MIVWMASMQGAAVRQAQPCFKLNLLELMRQSRCVSAAGPSAQGVLQHACCARRMHQWVATALQEHLC